MKKLILTFAIAMISICSFSQNLLTFQINSKVQISSGDSITTGAVCSFAAHVDNVASTGKIAYDINWYHSLTAKTNNWEKIYACTDKTNRMSTRLISYYQTVADPTAVSYDSMEAALKTWLESLYGAGNVAIVPIQ